MTFFLCCRTFLLFVVWVWVCVPCASYHTLLREGVVCYFRPYTSLSGVPLRLRTRTSFAGGGGANGSQWLPCDSRM